MKAPSNQWQFKAPKNWWKICKNTFFSMLLKYKKVYQSYFKTAMSVYSSINKLFFTNITLWNLFQNDHTIYFSFHCHLRNCLTHHEVWTWCHLCFKCCFKFSFQVKQFQDFISHLQCLQWTLESSLATGSLSPNPTVNGHSSPYNFL